MAYSSAPLSILLIAFVFTFGFHLDALQLGHKLSPQCSKTCESMFCQVPSPLLRYGKYCGFSYGGCPGEQPCDGLDACCMHHDHCIKAKGDEYLSVECNKGLQECVKAFRRSGAAAFKGSSNPTCDVHKAADSINDAMESAIPLGKILGIH